MIIVLQQSIFRRYDANRHFYIFAVFDVSYNAVNWFDKLLLTFMVRA